MLAMLVLTKAATAEVVIKSCNSMYSVKSGRESIVVERAGKVVGGAKIDHDIEGGVFSMDDSLIVVYGLPKKISKRYPQTTSLSVYKILPHPMIILKETYGGGVYDVVFSENQEFVVVANKFGVDVLSIVDKKSTSFGVDYVPKFRTRRCDQR